MVTAIEFFLDYTRKWAELVNKGGLIEVNNNFFIFIRRAETYVQQILNLELLKNYEGEELRKSSGRK